MQQTSPKTAMEPQQSGLPDFFVPSENKEPGVVITPRPDFGLLNVRTTSPENTHLNSIFGTTLPTHPNTITRAGMRIALWLGPDEYLLLLEDQQCQQTSLALASLLSGHHYAVNVVSDALAVYQLDGSYVRDILAKGCAIDLHPTALRPGQSFQSRLGHAGISCICTDENQMLIICRYSFSDYVETWLKDAGYEYGYQLQRD